MMTLAQKTRWSGSAYRAGIRILVVSLVLGLAAACTHVPNESSRGDGRQSAAAGEMEKGGVHFSIQAPEADRVFLIIMRTLVSTPATYEVPTSRRTDGVWTADVDLIPGEYRYFFIVDGSVTVDGSVGRVEQDDFGGVTGVLTVHQTPDGVLKTF